MPLKKAVAVSLAEQDAVEYEVRIKVVKIDKPVYRLANFTHPALL
jgi:hypothetical protein